MLVSVFELLADAREQVLAVNASIEALKDFWIAEADLRQTVGGKLPPAMPMRPRRRSRPPPAARNRLPLTDIEHDFTTAIPARLRRDDARPPRLILARRRRRASGSARPGQRGYASARGAGGRTPVQPVVTLNG